jgi:hypothetical protein
MKIRCKKECPKYNTCSLCFGGKECSYPEYSYLKYNWLEKFMNKITCKNKESKQSYSSICTADQNKSECSLIEELRELQNKKDELISKNTDQLLLRFIPCFYNIRGYGILIKDSNICEEKALELLKDAIKKEEIYLENKKEIEKINVRIKEIKKQLGIK